jgi:S-ribosylhomocysteine lyase LuxS involved in autoinducer biosynthesis
LSHAEIIEPTQFLLTYHYIIMQDPTDDASIPTKKYKLNAQIVGVRTPRKVANHTRPLFLPVAAAENSTFATLEDEDLPAAKRPRLQAPISISSGADGVVRAHTTDTVTTDPLDDAPTDVPTPPASLLRTAASRVPRRHWTPEEDAELTEAVQKLGKKWAAVAVLVHGRSDIQCRQRWVQTLDPANGNTGKSRSWKPDEDAELTKAVQKLGRTWAAVAVLVTGRTDKQCHQRWAYVLDPTNGNKGKQRQGTWKPEEDARLTEAVQKLGENWVAVAVLVHGRTDIQCRQRWVHTLDPANGNTGKLRRSWKLEEDAKLTKAVQKLGKKWAVVAVLVPGRSDKQCSQRWLRSLDPANNAKGKWTPDEDAELTKAVQKLGRTWAAVAVLVTGRTDKQCRERWVQTLDPTNGNKGKPRQGWKLEEDAKLTEAVQKLGENWVAVGVQVPGRTDKQCRHRWVCTLDPTNGNTGKPRSWKLEEDAKLTEAVQKLGKNWVAVAVLVPGRTNEQCRQRWVRSLDPANNVKGKWTPDEDRKLTEAMKKHNKDWVAAAKLVPGRTNEQCRQRWVTILDPDRASKAVEEEHNAGDDEAFGSVPVL